jgi:hypothetical protein
MIMNLFNSDELFILSRLIRKNYTLSLNGVIGSICSTINSCGDSGLRDIYIGLNEKLGNVSQDRWIGLVPLIVSFTPYDQDDCIRFDI